MLRTLENKDPITATQMLSDLASFLLPNPERRASINQLSDQHRAVLDELTEKSRSLARTGFSPRPTAHLFETLSTEMSEYSLKKDARLRAKGRLGNRGELPPAEYELKFANRLGRFRQLGINPEEVQATARYPDRSEHLLPEHFKSSI